MSQRLAGRVAIVTGTGRGIGSAIARLFQDEGASVLAVDKNPQAAASSHNAKDALADRNIEFLRADVSCAEDVRRIAAEAARIFGQIDILCQNAGIYPEARIAEMSEDEWERVLAVNLKSLFLLSKACLPHMKARNYGRIVVVSSITGNRTGIPGMAHYAASKAGLIGFVRSACLEFAPYRVTINGVEPGMVLTDGLKENLDENVLDEIRREIPLKELASPLDVARAVLFLAGDESSYITGQTIVVDGGLTIPELPLRLLRTM